MCGICGFVSLKKIDISQLKQMNDSMIHRGPDDSGEVIYIDNLGRYIGLGHRRLSIMDLSENGHQPMISNDGNVILTFNGEIYNFIELRTELEARGVQFKTKCDTEVVLMAYLHYGIDCLNKFNGMFAIALYDKRTETIILARDRMGVKPLYYYFKNGAFVWGSELKPIMLFPEFHKEIREEVLVRFFCHKFINAPDTIFKSTYKLEPGQYLVYKNGVIDKVKYWNILEKYLQGKINQYSTYNEAKSETEQIIEDSVKRRMVADVPVGIFLSGGIDSSLIAAIAQKNNTESVKTYTIGFETKEKDEAIYAKKIAQVIGTEHTELYISNAELIDKLRHIPLFFDEPFSDSSQIPTMLVSELARKDVKVVLSGDGGDELYCGYEMYDWVRKAQKLDRIGELIYNFPGIKQTVKKFPDKIYAFIINRDREYKTQLFTDVKERYVSKLLLCEQMNPKYEFEKDIDESDWQIIRMLIDMKSYLPEEVLTKMDRATMAYSLESRTPLVDYRLVESSFKVPQKYKYYKKQKKRLLKDIAYAYIDRSLLDRPKRGFSVPLNFWIRKYLSKEIVPFMDKSKIAKQGIFDYKALKWIYEMVEHSEKSVYSMITWSYYVFQRWYQCYIDDLWNND